MYHFFQNLSISTTISNHQTSSNQDYQHIWMENPRLRRSFQKMETILLWPRAPLERWNSNSVERRGEKERKRPGIDRAMNRALPSSRSVLVFNRSDGSSDSSAVDGRRGIARHLASITGGGRLIYDGS